MEARLASTTQSRVDFYLWMFLLFKFSFCFFFCEVSKYNTQCRVHLNFLLVPSTFVNEYFCSLNFYLCFVLYLARLASTTLGLELTFLRQPSSCLLTAAAGYLHFPRNILHICVTISRTYLDHFVGRWHFQISTGSDNQGIYFLKAMTNSFQASFSKVYFSKVLTHLLLCWHW